MNKNYIIAIDAMGGDNAPHEIVKGVMKYLVINNKISITLVGREDKIEKELQKYNYDKSKISIINANETIETYENPIKAIRAKKDSSILVGLELLKEKKADVLISAGNTGALLTGSTIKLGRINGVERPALGAFLPCEKGFTFLIDCGANVDCKSNYIFQFATMGSVYVENIFKIKNPRIGLVNIGVEEEKGNKITKEAYFLLKEASDLNFIGNIEGRDISKGVADIIVCDGFLGNVILKTFEGLSSSIFSIIKKELLSTKLSRFGALLSKRSFDNVKNRLDYSEIGGAPFLGLKYLVVKAHGSSKYKDIMGAINQSYNFIENDITRKISEKLEIKLLNN